MVYANVERIRKAKGITKSYMARRLGISLQLYYHISLGNVRLDVERLRRIANILGVEPGVFFDDQLTESVVRSISDTA
jgi:transcriptional regulator with XRE-family HTH domain